MPSLNAAFAPVAVSVCLRTPACVNTFIWLLPIDVSTSPITNGRALAPAETNAADNPMTTPRLIRMICICSPSLSMNIDWLHDARRILAQPPDFRALWIIPGRILCSTSDLRPDCLQQPEPTDCAILRSCGDRQHDTRRPAP